MKVQWAMAPFGNRLRTRWLLSPDLAVLGADGASTAERRAAVLEAARALRQSPVSVRTQRLAGLRDPTRGLAVAEAAPACLTFASVLSWLVRPVMVSCSSASGEE